MKRDWLFVLATWVFALALAELFGVNMDYTLFLLGLAVYVVSGLVLTVILFWAYVFTMGTVRVRERNTLTPLAYYLSLPVAVFGVFIDVVVNQLYFSVICLDFTHWGTVTSRMKRYKYNEATPWQKKVSAWVELQIDDYEDVPEGHI